MMELIEKIRNLSQREQKIISTAVLFLVFILFYYFLWENQFSRLNNLRKQMGNLENIIAQGKSVEYKSVQMKSELEYLRKRYGQISDRFLSSSDKGAVLEIADFFERYGTISSFQPGEAVKRKGYNILPISIVYEGYYEDFLDALKKLESGERIVDVENIKIEYREKNGSQIFTAELKLYLYQLINERNFIAAELNENIQESVKANTEPFRPKTKSEVQTQKVGGESSKDNKLDNQAADKADSTNVKKQPNDKKAQKPASANQHNGYSFSNNAKENDYQGYSFPTN